MPIMCNEKHPSSKSISDLVRYPGSSPPFDTVLFVIFVTLNQFFLHCSKFEKFEAGGRVRSAKRFQPSRTALCVDFITAFKEIGAEFRHYQAADQVVNFCVTDSTWVI